jgi:hypothetical protein
VDGRRFEELTRALAGGASRRGVLARAAAALASALLAPAWPAAAATPFPGGRGLGACTAVQVRLG